MKFRNYIIAIFLVLISMFSVYAYSSVYENFDATLVQGIEYTYHKPRKILFVQIEGRYDTLGLNSEEFLNAAFYYGITKLKLSNIPFHYAIDESGNVFKTEQSDEIRITNEPYIVVGYLSNNGQITSSAGNALLDLVEELSYIYGIQEYDVNSYTLVENENSFSDLVLSDPDPLFLNSINARMRGWEGYDREHIDYAVSIESIEYEKSLSVGERLDVKVVFSNNTEFIWYPDETPIYLSVKDSKESPFAVNQIWDSFSKVSAIDLGEYLLPGETFQIEFQLDPNLMPGEYSESFNLVKYDDQPFEGSQFKIDFTLEKGDGRVAQIESDEYGFVNIRECRRFSCEKMDIANDGEAFPILEYHESCWYKIQYDEGKEGWVYCPYIKEL